VAAFSKENRGDAIGREEYSLGFMLPIVRMPATA
jgi:hypothetical protein